MVNDDQLYNSFLRCAQLGAMPLVHAGERRCRVAFAGALSRRRRDRSRGPRFFAPAGRRRRGDQPGDHDRRHGRLSAFWFHTSCREAHEAIARARAAGKRVFGEPLIQHLVLDEDEYRNTDWDYAARRVMSPPFRAKEHQASLWAGLQSGSLQVVATDHCAFTTEQKRLGRGDFTKIPNGTGGLEDRMPVLWTAGVNTGRITKEEFVAITSTNAARILNVFPKKGAVAAGSDADIVVWDPSASKTISAKKQISRIDYNVFEGFNCAGLPRATLSRGAVAWIDNDLRGEAGAGQ